MPETISRATMKARPSSQCRCSCGSPRAQASQHLAALRRAGLFLAVAIALTVPMAVAGKCSQPSSEPSRDLARSAMRLSDFAISPSFAIAAVR